MVHKFYIDVRSYGVPLPRVTPPARTLPGARGRSERGRGRGRRRVSMTPPRRAGEEDQQYKLQLWTVD